METATKSSSLVTALLLFAVSAVAAQPTSQPSASPEPDTTTTSLTVGLMGTDFEVFPDSATAYDFSGAMRTIMLSTDNGALSVAYGRESNALEDGSTRVLDIFATTGGNAYILRNLLGLPFEAYIPIRFNINYRFSSIDFQEVDSQESRANDFPTRHFGSIGLGAGFGGRGRVPIDLPLIGDSFVVRGSYVMVPGAYGMFGGESVRRFGDEGFRSEDEESTIYANRTHDFTLELKVEKILDGNVGATIGFTQRWQNRTAREPESFADVIDTVLGSNEMVKAMGQSIIRIGINW